MADGADKAEHQGSGHRARLRGRLLEHGGDAFLGHELIEYRLAHAIPRNDTKPQAKRLLAHYGGLSRLPTFEAQKIVRAAALRLLSEPMRE